MEYTRYESRILVRLDPGDEIIASLTTVCDTEDIKLGSVSGIGAVNEATVGLFNPETKEYFSTELEKDYEVTNLTGNVSRMNDAVYLHLHATLADVEHKAFGGHLNSARVSATAEIWIDIVESEAGRRFDEKIGLNLLQF